MKKSILIGLLLVIISLFFAGCQETNDNSVDKNCNHTWSTWVTEKIASCKEEGIKIRYCIVCNDIERKLINKTALFHLTTTNGISF